ncbi:acyl-coenzyme A thioesterase 1-like isoform X1 [Branchiostoma floridae]|uniref:Acyl-coenzyme A thioesterase 1-like isoform X1 n=2 Tax=Branchiostoma floridae TaxID=7739 RepID=A0A9J7LH69_BRAFL|nr:acyl-coenzyme A thioesterase 1-like isoform X1 [Branchiostoma floridae]XP_035681645.1 acyl-coenzyme A thioesterase 1-like isoform X1 [Branchiostoma floridae]
MASIAVSPPTSLVTDKVDIRVTGLGKQQPVTLTAAVQYSRDAQFQSHAHYAADSSGSVVCSRHAAVGGSFSGVEQMGLLWSLQPAAAQRVKRMIPRDVTKPLEVQLCVYDGHIDTRRGQDGVPAPLASCVVERRFIRDGVRRIVVREGRVRGVLYLPEEEGPFPGVIDMYGSGANFEHRAALLSCQGFAAFRLMYCNFDDLPKAETHLDSEYFTDAVDWFSSHSLVQPGGVGVVGTSFGGLLALIMGTLTDKINAIVWLNGFSAMPVSTQFNYKGKILPTLGFDISRVKVMEEGHLYILDTVDDLALEPEKCIQVETIACPVLFVVSEDDKNLRSDKMAEQAIARMEAHGKTNHQLLAYPGAGHLLEPPYMPHCKISFHPIPGAEVDWGGETRAHCAAQEDLWPRMIAFLRNSRLHSQL